MDLSFSMEQQVLRENVRRYCRDQFHKKETNQNGSFNREHWTAFANMGWLGLLLPEEVGGISGSIIDAAIILEEFGRHMVTEPYLPCALLTAKTIEKATRKEPRNALLTAMAEGKTIVCLAHTEP